MRFRLLILLLLLVVASFSQNTFAQEVIVKRSSVVENYKGKPFYIHFVNKGETLTALAKAYNVSVEEISADNPVVDQGLKADMVLRIPYKSVIAIPDIETKPKADTKNEHVKPVEKQTDQSKPAEDQKYILHLVKKHETLYGISKQYNVSIDGIINANPGFDGLKEGLEIKIPEKKSTDKAVIEVVNEKEVMKKAPELVVFTIDEEKVRNNLKLLKDSNQLEGKTELIINGIRYYEQKTF